jgi:hypothetical protein
MSTVAKLQTKILTRQSKPGEYNVYRAHLGLRHIFRIAVSANSVMKSSKNKNARSSGPCRSEIGTADWFAAF